MDSTPVDKIDPEPGPSGVLEELRQEQSDQAEVAGGLVDEVEDSTVDPDEDFFDEGPSDSNLCDPDGDESIYGLIDDDADDLYGPATLPFPDVTPEDLEPEELSFFYDDPPAEEDPDPELGYSLPGLGPLPVFFSELDGIYDADEAEFEIALAESELEDLPDFGLEELPIEIRGVALGADASSSSPEQWPTPVAAEGVVAASLLALEQDDAVYAAGADGERYLAKILYERQGDWSSGDSTQATAGQSQVSLLSAVRSYWSMAQPDAPEGIEADVDCVLDFGDLLMLIDVKNYGSGRGEFHAEVDGSALICTQEVPGQPLGKIVGANPMSANMKFALDRYSQHFPDKQVRACVVLVSPDGPEPRVREGTCWRNEPELPVMTGEELVDHVVSLVATRPSGPVDVNAALEKLLIEP